MGFNSRDIKLMFLWRRFKRDMTNATPNPGASEAADKGCPVHDSKETD